MRPNLPDIMRLRWLARHRLLIWATLISLIAGVIEFGDPLDKAMRMMRNDTHVSRASGQIVIAGIDDRSIQRVGGWPWPEREYARLVERLNALGARRIVIDIDFPASSQSADRRLLERTLARSRAEIILPTRFFVDPVTGRRTEIVPPSSLQEHASLVNVNAWNDVLTGVWELPYAMETAGVAYPSLAAKLGGRSGGAGQTFPIDHAIELGSIPVVDAAGVMRDAADLRLVAGKDVVIGMISRQFGTMILLPHKGAIPRIFAHVLGAETLLAGAPVKLGWFVPFLLAFGIAAWAAVLKKGPMSRVFLLGGLSAFFIVPFALERWLIFADVVPAIMLLGIVTGARAWARLRHRTIWTNPVSGLPNLNALRDEEWAPGTALVAARIQNFAEITAALPRDQEKTFVGQIVNRIAVGADGVKIYQGEEGTFAWLVDKAASRSMADELEALHALFRSPVVVENRPIDLDLSFGVELGEDRLLANRLGSALVAADEACGEGLRWKAYDPAKLETAEWRLSLLSRLDAAIDTGEIWVAFQPKLDLATRRICGAEALARWTHPEKGDISPEDFVLAAEQHNRIEKLTAHVLSESIRSAAAINAQGIVFGVSVNLSARLLDNPKIVSTIGALLSRYALPPELLTLEVTESAALTNSALPLELLDKLRMLGLGVSLDDYGTGFSTLEYLKKVPANEIKIDKTFVGAMHKSRSDRLMVSSTIELAHSLDRRVVAEGVERMDTLEALESMGCDVAQGYLIGRPMPFHQFEPWLVSGQIRMVA